jgi:glycosyltransferase involved in cell wall biosynthesis
MKIMLATDLYRPMVGGVPTVTAELAAGLARRGHIVHLLAPRHPRADGGLPGVVEHLLPSVPWPFYPGLRQVVSASTVRAVLREVTPDVIHVHSPLLLGFHTLRAAERTGTPTIATNHYLPANAFPWLRRGGRAEQFISPAFYRCLIGSYRSCALVTAPTEAAIRLLRVRGLRVPTAVVSNGVDLARFIPGPVDDQLRLRLGLVAGRQVILSLMRLSKEKRIDVLIDAISHLPPGPQLAIASTGPTERALRRRVRRLGLENSTHFLGHVAEGDLPDLYRLADVFAVASPAELQSIATMNALASGVPVVAADAGALPEVLRGGGGQLFRPGDSTSMALSLTEVLQHADTYRPMARLGIVAHDYENVLTRWENLYRQARPPGPGR